MERIISKKLKGLMAEHRLTNAELSKKIGISPKTLSLRINGQRKWLYKELVDITKLFGFSSVKEVFPELYNSI